MNPPVHAIFQNLELLPHTEEHFKAWAAWAKSTLEAKSFEVLDHDAASQERHRGMECAWRALIARWATETDQTLPGGDRYTLSPDKFGQAAGLFLEKCHSAPVGVVRAAELLLRASLDAGATTPEVLSLAAAFAWPLRQVYRATGDFAWQALVRAPWQTDSAAMVEVIRRVHKACGFRAGMEIADLARERMQAGQHEAAREWLEAVVAIQTDLKNVEQVVLGTKFDPLERVRGAHEAMTLLAEVYLEHPHHDQIWVREVMRHVATMAPQAALIEVVEQRVWDRPLTETYLWAQKVKNHQEVHGQIKSALDADQPHHARRLAEAVLVAELDPPLFGGPQRTLPSALARFRRNHGARFTGSHQLKAAVEHLGLLYSRTNHVTSGARDFALALCGHTEFTGTGALLHAQKAELEEFVNLTSPYTILEGGFEQMHARRHGFSDQEKQALDNSQHWFTARFIRPTESVIGAVVRDMTSPIADLGERLAEVGPLAEVVESALRMALRGIVRISGDLEPVAAQGRVIIAQTGVGTGLAAFAREQTFTDQAMGALLSGGISFLPPGVSVAAAGLDLGASVMLAIRAIARVGAAFQIDMTSAAGERFVCDALTLGCSSKDGEGLVAYLSRGKRSAVTALSFSGVTYGAKYLVDYMWTSPGSAQRVAEQLIRHVSRLCGVQLSKSGAAKVIPLVGAVLSGMSTFGFIEDVREAAIQIATRDALLQRSLT